MNRTLHQPRKDDGGRAPVIALDDEFGAVPATLEANGSIVYDPRLKKWVMFAVAFSPTTAGPDRVRVYRFTSPDAMNWTKGDDGRPEHIRFDLHDAASGRDATNTDVFACHYDGRDAVHPYKGWLYFANWGEDLEGLYFVQSADGKTWTRGRQVARGNERKLEQDGRRLWGVGDVNGFYFDAPANRFLASLKFASPDEHGTPPLKNRLRSRAYLFVDALDATIDLKRIDRADLVPPAADANGDLPHDEYYGSTAWRYESLWLGGLKIWHGGGDYPYSAAGCAFLKLAVSRDGLDWTKVPFPNADGIPEVFIANGPEGGSPGRKDGRNDGGYLTEFSQGPLRIGDELIFYYGCSSWGKNHPPGVRVTGGGIFRARLRPDGFVSVDAGTLTTKPLAFDGDELFVNGVGPLRVEVIQSDGKTLADAKVQGDSLSHRVRFAGRSLRELAGEGPTRFRFVVEDGGRVYSFKVSRSSSSP